MCKTIINENVKDTAVESKDNTKKKEKRGMYQFRVEKEDYPKLEKIYQALKGDWSAYTEEEMIIEKRILSGLTQKDVAGAVGVASSNYSKWEKSIVGLAEEKEKIKGPVKLRSKEYSNHDEIFQAIKSYVEVEYDITRYMMEKGNDNDPIFNIAISLDWEVIEKSEKPEARKILLEEYGCVDENVLNSMTDADVLKTVLTEDVYTMLVEEYGCEEEAEVKEVTVTEVLKEKLEHLKSLGYVPLTQELRARIIRIVQLTGRTVEQVCMDFGVLGDSVTIRMEQKELSTRRVLC